MISTQEFREALEHDTSFALAYLLGQAKQLERVRLLGTGFGPFDDWRNAIHDQYNKLDQHVDTLVGVLESCLRGDEE